MELKDFLKLLGRKKQTMFTTVSIVLLIFLVFSFAQPLNYRATTKLLIIHNSSSDAYTASKSTQFLGSTLAEVIRSDSFLSQVLKSGYNLDKNIFSENQEKRKKEWDKMVSVRASNDTGIMVVDTYNQDKYQASQYNQAIAYTLVTKHNLYHGLGNKVSVKIIDGTSTSSLPVKPNILLNSLLGIAFGVIISFFFIYLYPEKDIKLSFRKRKKITNNFLNEKNRNDFHQNHLNYPEDNNYPENRDLEGDIRNIED